MFDPECYALASHYLHGEPFGLSARKEELAQVIQNTVNAWLVLACREVAAYTPPKEDYE